MVWLRNFRDFRRGFYVPIILYKTSTLASWEPPVSTKIFGHFLPSTRKENHVRNYQFQWIALPKLPTSTSGSTVWATAKTIGTQRATEHLIASRCGMVAGVPQGRSKTGGKQKRHRAGRNVRRCNCRRIQIHNGLESIPSPQRPQRKDRQSLVLVVAYGLTYWENWHCLRKKLLLKNAVLRDEKINVSTPLRKKPCIMKVRKEQLR